VLTPVCRIIALADFIKESQSFIEGSYRVPAQQSTEIWVKFSEEIWLAEHVPQLSLSEIDLP